MDKIRRMAGILFVAALVGTVPILSAADLSADTSDGDLLHNPGFEGPYVVGLVHVDDWIFRDNIFTPEGWVTWWRQGFGDGGEYGQPEVQVISADHPNYGYDAELPRIYSGWQGLKVFNQWRPQDAGIYQVVTGLQPGATVQLSAYAHGWTCDNSDVIGYTCVHPWNQLTFQVGIEPNGVADPFSPMIIWAPPEPGMIAPDHFQLIGPVTARVGPGGAVTAIIRSHSKWGLQHIDAYWDQTSLIYVDYAPSPTDTPVPADPTATPMPDPPTATPVVPTSTPAGPGPDATPTPSPTVDPATPTPKPTATPWYTPTPRPDGAVVHVVRAGDTLFGIASTYGVTVEHILLLNQGSIGEGDLILVGQELVVALFGELATETPTPEPESIAAGDGESSVDEGEATPTLEDSARSSEISDGVGSVCVLSFHDRNADMYRDQAVEELLRNGLFALTDDTGVVAQYASDGMSEPYCFSDLPSGTYVVQYSPPDGYVPSGPVEWAVPVGADAVFTHAFGSVPVADPGAYEYEEVASVGEAVAPPVTAGSTVDDLVQGVIGVSGLIVLGLSGAAATLFYVSRRAIGDTA